MLQTKSAGNPPRLVLFTDHDAPQPSSEAPCQRSAEFLEVFEQLTGWRAEFEESQDSVKRRQMIALQNEPAEGSFEVVDMSEAWPAKTATAHRGRSDKLIHLFGDLMSELQQTRIELTRAHSALAALSPGSIGEEAELVDAFIPKFGNIQALEKSSTGQAHFDFESDEESAAEFLYDSVFIEGEQGVVDSDDFEVAQATDYEFVVQQEVTSISRSPKEIWNNWSFGGTSGMADEVYLDWFMQDEKMTICVGRIESSFGNGDSETAIEIDPIVNKYRVTGDRSFNAFYIWDRRGGKMTQADRSGDWVPLHPGAAVFSSTNDTLQAPDPEAELSHSPSAEQLAKVLSRDLPSEQRVLVLKRK